MIRTAFLALSLVLLPAMALAQNCAPREVVAARLAERYGETRRGAGLVQGG